MPNFSYKVRDGRGELISGMLQAASMAEAGNTLRADGNFIVKLDQVLRGGATADDASSNGAKAKPKGKIKTQDVITFSHQLAVMVDTGVPISESLQCIADQAENEAFKAVVNDVAASVEGGGELSKALGEHPKVFPSIMISLVRASEVSGTMGPMLERISKYMGKEHQTVKKIKGALMYPAFMLVMIIVVTIGLLVWVLPRFAGIFESKGADLPLPTVMLMAISDALMVHWYYWIAGVIAAVVGFMMFRKTATGQRFIDQLKLSSPIFGSLFTKLYTTRATRTMGTMINAGVPILDMIEIVRYVTPNKLYEELWDAADDKLRQGSQLSDVLFGSPLLPKSVAQMIYAGERSGRLGPTMEKIADFTEEEFDDQIKTTTSFIEPLMVGLMGGIVGFVAIALLLPIFTVSKVVS